MLKRLIIFFILIGSLSFTVSGAFTGTFTHETSGNIVTLTPNLGNSVDYYKFVIKGTENDYTSETPWIDTDDTIQNSYVLRRGDYVITMYFRNCTMFDMTQESVHIATQEQQDTVSPLEIADDEDRIKKLELPKEITDWYDSLSGFEQVAFILSIAAIAVIGIFSKDNKFIYYILKKRKK